MRLRQVAAVACLEGEVAGAEHAGGVQRLVWARRSKQAHNRLRVAGRRCKQQRQSERRGWENAHSCERLLSRSVYLANPRGDLAEFISDSQSGVGVPEHCAVNVTSSPGHQLTSVRR